jgi:hypothetical protein
MRTSKLPFLAGIFSLLSCGAGNAQDFWRSPASDSTDTYWQVVGSSDYTYSKTAGSWYAGGSVGLVYNRDGFRFGALVNVNQSQNFFFQPGRLIIEVDDANVEFADSTRFTARPDQYDIVHPFSGFFSLRKREWQVTAFFSALIQHSDIEQPQPGIANDSLFFISWLPINRSNTRLLNSVVATYNWRNFEISGGFLGLSLISAGDDAFKYEYEPKPYPFFEIGWNPGNIRLAGSTDSKSLAVSVSQPVTPIRLKGKSLRSGLHFQSGLRSFGFHSLLISMGVPISDKVCAAIAYRNVWSSEGAMSRSDFQQWQKANVFGALLPLNNILPQHSLSINVAWTLDRTDAPWPLQVLNFKLFQKQIFSAKREFYANNPIATVDLYNDGDRPITLQLSLETTGKAGTFQTESFRIHSKEIKTVPLFFYFGKEGLELMESSEQLILSARVGDRFRMVDTQPITIHGHHAWDGNTWGLRYFISPDDPFLKERAKQVYLGVVAKSGNLDEPKNKLARVSDFIDEFGKGLRYISDPTTSMAVDQVQYPVETLMKGSGDCEDLTVCLASGLMAVGIHTAVVDVRPKLGENLTFPTAEPGALGHVFILVDTGIAPQFMTEIGLTEFQAVTRQNALGQPTLWLPIEVTALSNGFDAAFRMGVRQYYQEIVAKEGVVSGNVHIYDF